MSVIHFNQAGFDSAIPSAPLAAVDFWAGWCGPCKMVAPVIEQLAEQYKDKAIVGKVDVDAEGALASRYGITSIPTVIFFKNGQEVDRKVGVLPLQAYSQVFDGL